MACRDKKITKWMKGLTVLRSKAMPDDSPNF